ncbi:MAG: c-type cytochrome [Sphingobacteriales bacterium]|nr:c-type cytochrome [Sphingobacteriales bacterium]
MRNFSSDFRKLVKSITLLMAFIAGTASFSFAQAAQADSTQAGSSTSAAIGDPKAGDALFQANCASCHKLNQRLVGPPLMGVTEKRSNEWLHKWISNSPAFIATGEKDAVAIYNEYNQAGMPPFPQFSDADIDNILAYIKTEGDKLAAAAKQPAAGGSATTDGGVGATEDGGISDFMLVGLVAVVIIAFLVILVLNRVIGTLERLLIKKDIILPDEEGSEPRDKFATVKKLARNKKFVFFLVSMITITMGSFGWMDLWNTGVQQGYQPVQPIKFSHELHAGTNQIQCQYCHSGAWKSKNATIPSLNICMNCHKYVQATEKYGGKISPEIQKIYSALDYDSQTQKYGDQPKPIEWVRIHNLPDLAYFNHSQHVKVAGIECQKCHGPIETMKEVYQYSPLTMKWCINCHKETQVNYKGNAYYDNLVAYHDKIKKGEKVTAAVLGGIECGKCHY